MPCRRNQGFTLVELMITLVVMGVLAAIAVPGFQDVMRSNRIATSTNAMLAAMSLARSEAIKNTKGAGVCASQAGSACDGETWADGWLVWSDADQDGALGAQETVIQYTDGNPKLIGDAQALSIAFDSRGRRRAPGDQSVVLQPDKCGSRELRRTLRVMPTGQVKIDHGACE